MSEMKYEKAIKRLEEIVEDLENSDLDIDRSLKVFEEGVRLSRFCAKKLDEAEKKIEVLTKNEKGEFVAELFAPADLENS